MIRFLRSVGLVLPIVVLLAGCQFPQGAGTKGQITAGADAEDANFAVYPVTRDNLLAIKSWPLQGPIAPGGWIGREPGPAGQIIAPGDKLDVAIWDNEESSLLNNPGQKVVNLQGLTVSKDGTIFLPYVSEIYVGRMTPDEAREAIQAKMVTVVPSVQVQLNHSSGRQNSVDLIGGVANPGVYPLLDRDTTVLTLISQGGGVGLNVTNPQVRLTRGGRLYGTSYQNLLRNPSLDTTLQGGDKIFVEEEERYFLALGSTGSQSRIVFPTDTVSAIDALTLAGGLNASRANPKGLLVLRNYPSSAIRSDGRGPDKQRAIFTFDLTTADGLFSAGDFPLQSQDVVIATETNLTATRNVIGLVTSLLVISSQINRQ